MSNAAQITEQPEGATEEERAGPLSWSLRLLLPPLGLYLGIFGLIMVDVIFLDEALWNLLPSAMQHSLDAWVRVIYAPLLWLVDLVI